MAVEKGDFTSVKFFLEDASIYFNMDINCIDALGRTALHIGKENSFKIWFKKKTLTCEKILKIFFFNWKAFKFGKHLKFHQL